MKVRELVARLNEFDENMDVLCASEDEAVLEKGQLVRLFDVDSVEVVQVERMRDENRKPRIKIGGDNAKGVVFISVTADF